MEQHTTHTNTEVQPIDLSVLLRRMGRALTRLWPVCLALVVLCAALMGWRGHRSFRPMYRSDAVFSVNLSFVGGTDLSGYSQYYNKSAAQQVADTFPYLLTSDRMQELLLQRLGVTYLNGVISSSAIKDTSFFVLTVESPSPQDAYDILCAVIDVYPQVNRLVLGETQLVVNQEPSLPDTPYNADPWVRSAVKGAALGVVLALAVLIVAAALRRTVSSTGDVKRLVSLTALASIPRTAPKRRKNGPQQGLLITRMQTDSAFCEAYRLLRLKLLRQLKPALAPHGVRQGRILFRDAPLEQVDQRTQAARIGFVQQSPENQIVTDKVWHELAFGLESLGTDTPTIRRRVAEMAAFFGIEDWFYRDVAELSGGQKQLLNLASVMAMQPDVLILDEPTSQLDPIAASDFLAVLGKINRELGTAVVLTEHRLEEAFPLATAVAVMDRGRLLCTGTPQQVGRQLKTLGHGMFLAMPAAMRIWASVETEAPCPVTVREGRDFLRRYAAERPLGPLPREKAHPRREPVITARGVWFRYEPDSPDVVKGLDLTLGRGEFLALLGGNGAGKSTTLKLLSGMKKPQRGNISVKGTLGMLPQ